MVFTWHVILLCNVQCAIGTINCETTVWWSLHQLTIPNFTLNTRLKSNSSTLSKDRKGKTASTKEKNSQAFWPSKEMYYKQTVTAKTLTDTLITNPEQPVQRATSASVNCFFLRLSIWQCCWWWNNDIIVLSKMANNSRKDLCINHWHL